MSGTVANDGTSMLAEKKLKENSSVCRINKRAGAWIVEKIASTVSL